MPNHDTKARGTNESGPISVIAGNPLLARVKATLPKAPVDAVQHPAEQTPESPENGALDLVRDLDAMFHQSNPSPCVL